MGTFEDPFETIDDILHPQVELPPIVLIDFHAEDTSEKTTLAWSLYGRVSAVVGTHTHGATADARILRKGTAYVTDIGEVGPSDSIVEGRPWEVLEAYLTRVPRPCCTTRPGKI